MNNGEERKGRKRKRSEDRKVDADRQSKAGETNENGSNLDDPGQQQRSTEALTGPEVHLCKALLEGKVREYIVLKELSAELGNEAAELVNMAESRIQTFLESYKQGETATSQTRALAESLEQISHALQGFCSAQGLPKYPLTPAYLLVFAWVIFHDGVDWDSANKRKLLEMLDTIQSHGNQPFNDARPKAIRANQHLFVYTMLDTETYEGIMTATEGTLESYKRFSGYEEKPSYQATAVLKEEEDSSDAEVANSLLASKQAISSSQYSQSRASSSKDSKRGYESSASYEGNGERTSRPSSKRKQKPSESTSRQGSKKGKSSRHTEDNQAVASTSAVTLEHSDARPPAQKHKRPRPSASASSVSSNFTKQESKTLSIEQSRPTSTSPRPAKRRLVAPPSPPEEATEVSAAELTTVVLETESESDEAKLAAAKAEAACIPEVGQTTSTIVGSAPSAVKDRQRDLLLPQLAGHRHGMAQSVALDNASASRPPGIRPPDARDVTDAAVREPTPVRLTPILPHSPSPSVRPELSASSEADNAKLGNSLGGAPSPTNPPKASVSMQQLPRPGGASSNALHRSEAERTSAGGARAADSVAKHSTRHPISPIQHIRVIEIFDSDEEEEALAAAAAKEIANQQAKDKGKEKIPDNSKYEGSEQGQQEADEDTGPNVAGIRAQVPAHVSDSEEEIDELEEDATFIQPQTSTAVPPPSTISETHTTVSLPTSAITATSELARARNLVMQTLAATLPVPSEISAGPPPAPSASRLPAGLSTETTELPGNSARPTLHPPAALSLAPVAPTSNSRSGQTGSPSLRPAPDQTSSKDTKAKGKASTDGLEQQNASTSLRPCDQDYAAPSSSIVQNALSASTAAQAECPPTASTSATSNVPKAKTATNGVRTSAAMSKTPSQNTLGIGHRGAVPANLQQVPHEAGVLAKHPSPLLPIRVEPFEAMEDRWDTVFEELEQHVWHTLDRTGSGDPEDVEQLRRDEEEYHTEQTNMKRALKAYTQMRNRRRRARRSATVEKLKKEQADAARRNILPSASSNPKQASTSSSGGPAALPKPVTVPIPTIAQSATGQGVSPIPNPVSSSGPAPSMQPARSTPLIRPSGTMSSGQDQLKQPSLHPQVPATRLNPVDGPDHTDKIDDRAQELLQRLTQGSTSARPSVPQIAEPHKCNEVQTTSASHTSNDTLSQDQQVPSVERPQSITQEQPGRQAQTVTAREGSTPHDQSTAQTAQNSARLSESVRKGKSVVETRPRFPDFFASIRKPTLATELRVQRPAQFTLLPYINGGQQASMPSVPVSTNAITTTSALPNNGSISGSVSTSNNVESASGQEPTPPQPDGTGIDPKDTVLKLPTDGNDSAHRPGEELRRSVPSVSHSGPRPATFHRSVHGTSALQPPITGPFAPRMPQEQVMLSNVDPRSVLGASAGTSDLSSEQQSHRRHVSLDHPMWRRMAQSSNPNTTTSVQTLNMSGQPIGVSTDAISPAVSSAPVRDPSQQLALGASSTAPNRSELPICDEHIRQQAMQETDLTSASTAASVPLGSVPIVPDSQPARLSAAGGSAIPSQQGSTLQTQPQSTVFALSRSQGQPHYPESRTQQNHIPFFQQMHMISQQHQRHAGLAQTPASAVPNHLQRVATGRAMSPPSLGGTAGAGQANTPVTASTARQQSPQLHTNSPPLVQALGHAQRANQIQQLFQSQRNAPPRQTVSTQQQQQAPHPQASNQQLLRQPQEASVQHQAPVQQQAGSPQLSQSQQGHAPSLPSVMQPYPQQQMQASSSRQLVQTAPVLPFKQGDGANWFSRQHMIEHYAQAHGEQGLPGAVEHTANFFASTGMSPEEVQQFRSRAFFLMAMKRGHGPTPPQ